MYVQAGFVAEFLLIASILHFTCTTHKCGPLKSANGRISVDMKVENEDLAEVLVITSLNGPPVSRRSTKCGFRINPEPMGMHIGAKISRTNLGAGGLITH